MKLAPLIAFFATASASFGGTVIADFNDLLNGPLPEIDPANPGVPTGQPADTGVGFTEPYWSNNTGLVAGIDGDLTPPAGSNYIAGQTGDGRSLANTFGDRVRRLQSRSTVSVSGEEIWLSALFSLNGTDAEGTIAFNGLGSTLGGTANLAPGISFGDNGTPGAVGFLLPSEDALANVADVSQRIDNAVATDGVAHLIVAKIELSGGDDTITLWLDPLDMTDEASMGAASLVHTGAYFDDSVISRIGYEVVREDDPSFDPNGGLAVLDNLKISDAPNAFDVVTKAATSVTPPAELVVTEAPAFGDLVETPTSVTSAVSVVNNGDSTPLMITGLTFGGADAAHFSTGAVFPITVEPNGGNADIPVTFDPAGSVGFFSATLGFVSDAPNSVPPVNLTAAFTKDGVSVLVNGDFESDGAAITDWNASGEGAVAPVAGIAPGSGTAAELAPGAWFEQSANLTPNFYAEFFFSAPDTQARAFNVLVNGPGGGQINIRYQGDLAQWNAFDNVNVNDSWGADLGLGTLTSNATYFMRIVGNDWGTPETTYDLYLSEANSVSLSRSVEGLTRFQNAVPNARARSLRFSTQFGSAPGFIVDDVALVTGPPPPANPVAITGIVYDDAADTVTILWDAQIGVTYFIEASSDLVDWSEELDDSTADSAEESFTETGVTALDRFYRVREE